MKKWFWFVLIVLIMLSVYAEFGSQHDSHSSHQIHSWGGIPMFYLIFGFWGCILLIIFAKLSGYFFLERKEDYYDAE